MSDDIFDYYPSLNFVLSRASDNEVDNTDLSSLQEY